MWIEMMGIWFFTGRVTRCMLLRIALSIILLIYYQTNMNFLQLLSSGASLFNFNLLNAVGNLGLTPSLEITTPKTLTPEQIIKEPNSSNPTKAVNEGECDDGALQKEARVELFTKQQQLINQYMHLNIQLLSKKLENLEQIEKLPRQQQAEPQVEVKSGKKKIKKTNNCGHPEKEHYAKGMCSNCYHKYGRNKKPWNCPHDKLYANGMCQNCYINSYNRKRREERDEKPDSNDCHSELKEEQQS